MIDIRYNIRFNTSTIGLATSRGLRPALLDNVEIDYLGMIDFCLKPVDNALSGPSRSKILNALTNDIFEALIINYEPLVIHTIAKLSDYRNKINETECLPSDFVLNNDGMTLQECELKQSVDIKNSYEYISRLEQLIKDGIVHDTVLGGIYDKGYKGLLTALRDAGCKFPNSTTNVKQRPYPLDKNICLSVLDLSSNLNVNYNSDSQTNFRLTKTREMNQISNSVSRAILYGSKHEKDFLANSIDNDFIRNFAFKWKLADSTQEIKYLKGLSLLLRVGISKAEEAVNSIDTSRYENILISGIVGGISIESLVNKNVDTTASYQELNLQANKEKTDLRLYDSYLSAFHRIIEFCFAEISTNSFTYFDKSNPQLNDEFLLNFVQWEQSLRRNLTSFNDFWNQNPSELVGTWEFVDIKGDGGLQSLLINSDEYLDSNENGRQVKEKQVVSYSFHSLNLVNHAFVIINHS